MTIGYLDETPADRAGRLEREREEAPLHYMAGEMGELRKSLTGLIIGQQSILKMLEDIIQLLKHEKSPEYKSLPTINVSPPSGTAGQTWHDYYTYTSDNTAGVLLSHDGHSTTWYRAPDGESAGQ